MGINHSTITHRFAKTNHNMHLYLVRITNSTKPHIEARYKTGYTKWGPNNIIKGRFRYNDDFKGLDVELLAVKNIQHESAYKARGMCMELERKVFKHIPKKEWGAIDNIEEHFEIEQRPESFGCTEFHHKDIALTKDELIMKWCQITGGDRV